jgi:RNA-directed DNA polymerase
VLASRLRSSGQLQIPGEPIPHRRLSFGPANSSKGQTATARLKECGLELHPEKTKLVYCKDANRQESHPNEKFDFLGYTFRPRAAVNRKGKLFCSFSSAISKKAVQKVSDEIRSWQLHRRTADSIVDLAKMLNPKLRGWFTYYGRFNPSALRPIERHVGQSLVRWACRKCKKLRGYRIQAWGWLARLIDRHPTLLALWERQRSQVFSASKLSSVRSPTIRLGS